MARYTERRLEMMGADWSNARETAISDRDKWKQLVARCSAWNRRKSKAKDTHRGQKSPSGVRGEVSAGNYGVCYIIKGWISDVKMHVKVSCLSNPLHGIGQTIKSLMHVHRFKVGTVASTIL